MEVNNYVRTIKMENDIIVKALKATRKINRESDGLRVW
jgi:hypothetical protein